jgi:serine/threonine protein kinase
MSRSAGTRLGPYEILITLGVGGKGEVYRAKDTKLGRDVALKILPASFTNDPERVARVRDQLGHASIQITVDTYAHRFQRSTASTQSQRATQAQPATLKRTRRRKVSD